MAGSPTSGWTVGAVVGGAHRLVALAEARGVIPTWQAEALRRPGLALSVIPLPPGAAAPARFHAPLPGVVALAEVRAHEGAPYAVAPWVEGAPLERWLDGFERRRPPAPVAWRAFAGLCALVGEVHRAREPAAHGWLSPRSFVVTGDRVALLDLGLAELDARPTWRRSDGVDAWAWASPERARGGAASARGDVFSLAVILVEVLAGSPLAAPDQGLPWWRAAEAGEAAVLARLRALGLALSDAAVDRLAHALAGDPTRRPPDAAALLCALREAGAHEEGATTPSTTPHLDDAFAAAGFVTEPAAVARTMVRAVPGSGPHATLDEAATTPIERGGAPEATAPARGPIARTAPMPAPPPAARPAAPSARTPEEPTPPRGAAEAPPVWALAALAALLAVAVAAVVYGLMR